MEGRDYERIVLTANFLLVLPDEVVARDAGLALTRPAPYVTQGDSWKAPVGGLGAD